MLVKLVGQVDKSLRFRIGALHQRYRRLRSKLLRRKVDARKEYYNKHSGHFNSYPEVTFVIQSFNKASVVSQILDRLLSYHTSHIVLLDDGSVDRTYQMAMNKLVGKNHLILRTNDLYEVTTYDMALRLADTDFVCLMQDDDIPPIDDEWIKDSLELFKRDRDLIILGLRAGLNYRLINDGRMHPDSVFRFDGRRVWIDGVYEAHIVSPQIFVKEGKGIEYCQVVNRAPTFIRLQDFLEIGGIDRSFAPFQNDDVDYCLRAWQHGKRVMVLTGCPFLRDIGIGGMRIYNDIAVNKRKDHMCDNWHRVAQRYKDFVNSGDVMHLVDTANEKLLDLKQANGFDDAISD